MTTLCGLRIGDFEVEPSLNQIHKGHDALTIEPRVMDLLMLLAESPGKVFGRDEILERVWPETKVQDDALRRAVTLLRRALNDDPKQPQYIETITRRGYRLVAPVSRPDSQPSASPTPHASAAKTRRWKWPRLSASVVAVAILIVTVAWLAKRDATPLPQLDLRPLTSLPGHESEPAFSTDGRSVAFIHQDGGDSALMVKSVSDEDARELLQHPELTAPTWSPDGDRVLVATRGENCEIFSTDAYDPSAVRTVYTCSGGERVDTILQPDAETLIFNRRPGRFGSPWRVHRYDLVTQESTQLTLPVEPGSGDVFLALSADRRRVAVIRHLVSERSKLLILDWASGVQQVIDNFPDTVWHVSWSADGRSLVFADGAELSRFNLESHTTERLISSPRDLFQPSVSPVGDRIAVVDQRLLSNIVRQHSPLVEPVDEPEVVASSTRVEFMPRFGPDGDQLAFVSGRSGRSEVWVSGPDGELNRLFGVDRPNHIHAFLWSPTGDRIAVSDHHGRLLIVDVASGESELVPGGPSSGGLLDWSADGSSIYLLEVTEGSPEAWKVGLEHGQRRQITRGGVRTARESPDGKALYVTRWHTPGLWRVELGGDGRPTKILDDVVWYSWKTSDRGIYSFESVSGQTGIFFRQAIVGEPVLMVAAPTLKLDFSVSNDHRWLAYAQVIQPEGDIILIEGEADLLQGDG